MVLGGTVSAATSHFGTRSLLYFLYSKHCDSLATIASTCGGIYARVNCLL